MQGHAMRIPDDARGAIERVKKNICSSHTYFQKNYDRFNEFRKFVFESSVSANQRSMLKTLKKPVVEANILEAYISRLLGEFAKHEPSITVSAAEGVPVEAEVIDIIEGFIRHITYEANKSGMSYEIYKDLLSGGFSVQKVWTEYASPMSMKQVIRRGRAFDPTMCGFDPMARDSHKGDGQYCFELFPMTEEDFKRDYPKAAHNQISYSKSIDGFSWSYRGAKGEKIILIADYFEKKKKRAKIVSLANGRVIKVSDYKKLIEFWEANQLIEQIPVIVGKPRWTSLETVCRYTLTESEILSYEETDYTYLPLIFVDGNSVLLREGSSGSAYQMTRPYVYQAKGIQNLKNFAMQSLANYLENMVMHKFIVKKEAIPQEEDYQKALTDIQSMNTVVVNAYSNNDPNKPIPEPIREVVNVPAPPEVMAAFQASDPTVQTILGSYASNLGQNDNDLSGKAVIESASVGNAASMPFIVGYLAADTQAANIIVDLMPKYITGKREVPIVTKSGENGYEPVNQEGAPYLDYEEAALTVVVEAGVNFQVQKNQALQQITSLMSASPEFAAFMNDDESLPIIVDNLTIYGVDRLKEAVPKWIEKKNQQQQQAMQMQQQQEQQSPQAIKAQVDMQKAQIEAQTDAQKTQLEEQKIMMQSQIDAQKLEFQRLELMMTQQQNDIDNELKIAKLSTEDKIADSKILEAEAKVSQAQVDSAVQLEKSNTSLETHALDSATKMAEIKSREHANHRENIKLARELSEVDKD